MGSTPTRFRHTICRLAPPKTFDESNVRGFLHEPVQPTGDALALTHGAGSNCEAPLLVELAQAFADAGITVLRFDLPFRQARPHGPPRPGDATRDRDGIRAAVQALRKIAVGRLFLGGHSYGGRQASMMAADDASSADALLLLSYPLHPPRRPEQLRTAHFPQLTTPAFFVHGERDPFATPAELDAALALIPARTSVLRIAGAGHDLRAGRHAAADLPATIVRDFLAFTAR